VSLPGCVAVVGLGLMGGSLARDLAARGVRVLGHDRDPGTLRAAEREGIVPLPDLSAGALAGVELLVLAVPVDAAEALLGAVAPSLPPACLLTDLGSTKRSIAAAAERLGVGDRFVGSHPLAGDHRSGWQAARGELFRGATVYLCPTPAALPEALHRLRDVWLALGARPETVPAAAHDRQLAWTSHLPQVTASALAATLLDAGLHPGQLGPGGRDATRLAASSPEMWTAIALDNRDELKRATEGLLRRLDAFRGALQVRDRAAIHHFFAEARHWTEEGGA
jgi:prephenate dehydrogenase